MAMTFYEMTRPEARETGFFDRIGARLTKGMKAMQYARMVEAMNLLTDDQLATVGISRRDIPAHSHKCIYGA